MGDPLNLYNHRPIINCGGQDYCVAVRSFNHKGKQLYQATVLEGVHVNYQPQGTRGEVFASLRAWFSMIGTADKIAQEKD